MTRVRYYHGKREYLVTDGKNEQSLKSDEPLPQGACVNIGGEMTAGGLVAKKIEILDGEKAKKTYEMVRAKILSGIVLPTEPQLVKDNITEKIWPQITAAASELICAKKLGRSVLLRFHGDADGIAGAFAITSFLHCKAFQQNSAIYGVRDALRDIALIGQENRPLLLLVDFGSSNSCKEALDLVVAAGIQYIIIDHHPYDAKDNKAIINPIAIQEDASRYTAGYLACELSVACGMDQHKANELAKTACSGDKSDIIPNGDNEAKMAMVLDFLASHMAFGNNLDFYRKVVDTPDLFSSIAQQANESIEDAAAKALSRAKRGTVESGNGQVETCVFSLDGIVTKGEWPPSSKITTRIFEKIKEDKPLVCIGYTDRSVIIRLNDQAAAIGLSANELAERIKRNMADFVDGGGGHVRAGAIRAKTGFVKEVVNQLLREIEENGEN